MRSASSLVVGTLLVLGSTSLAFADSQSASLGVYVTVARSCSVNASWSTVNVTCSRGATPGIISGTSTAALPMSSAMASTAALTPANVAAATGTRGSTGVATGAATATTAASTAAPQVVASTMTAQAADLQPDGTLPAPEQIITINF
jgi:hypothetical protein